MKFNKLISLLAVANFSKFRSIKSGTSTTKMLSIQSNYGQLKFYNQCWMCFSVLFYQLIYYKNSSGNYKLQQSLNQILKLLILSTCVCCFEIYAFYAFMYFIRLLFWTQRKDFAFVYIHINKWWRTCKIPAVQKWASHDCI